MVGRDNHRHDIGMSRFHLSYNENVTLRRLRLLSSHVNPRCMGTRVVPPGLNERENTRSIKSAADTHDIAKTFLNNPLTGRMPSEFSSCHEKWPDKVLGEHAVSSLGEKLYKAEDFIPRLAYVVTSSSIV